jgi:hypothetical protein
LNSEQQCEAQQITCTISRVITVSRLHRSDMAQNTETMYETSRTQPDPSTTGSYAGGSGGANEGGVLDSAKETARGLMDQVKDQATTQAEEKKHTMASGLRSVADAFRQMGDGLAKQENGPVAKYAADLGRAAGNQTEKLSRYMEGRDVHEMVDDLHDFARRKPALFLGGALLLGLGLSRFLKSSRPSGSGQYNPRETDRFADSERFRMPPAGGSYGGSQHPRDVQSPSAGTGGVQNWPSRIPVVPEIPDL